MIYKSLQRKLKIEQHEPHKYWDIYVFIFISTETWTIYFYAWTN
jgi:hypothetical protein